MNEYQIIKKINKYALSYKKNLLNTTILFIYGDYNNLEFVEVSFFKRNFKHLTGSDSKMKSEAFFDAAIDQKLNLRDFIIDKTNQMLHLKLQILGEIVNIHTNSRYIGEHKKNGQFLQTDKLVGNKAASLGIVKNKVYYVPNSALKFDIRKITTQPKPILVSLQKKIKDKNYSDICYLSKNVEFNELKLPKHISDLITLNTELNLLDDDSLENKE